MYTKLGAETLAKLAGRRWATDSGALTKRFAFKSHTLAAEFAAKAAKSADALQHHPEIYIKYRWITFALKTNDADGAITDADAKLADAIDELAKADPGLSRKKVS